MKIFLIVLGILAVLSLVLKFWNKYSLRYNHKILTNSKCQNCSSVLGNEALLNAVKALDEEKELLKHEAKVGTVTLHNMKIICPACNTEILERDLYKTNRENR